MNFVVAKLDRDCLRILLDSTIVSYAAPRSQGTYVSQPFGDALESSFLSTDVAGGFQGATLGLFAHA